MEQYLIWHKCGWCPHDVKSASVMCSLFMLSIAVKMPSCFKTLTEFVRPGIPYSAPTDFRWVWGIRFIVLHRRAVSQFAHWLIYIGCIAMRSLLSLYFHYYFDEFSCVRHTDYHFSKMKTYAFSHHYTSRYSTMIASRWLLVRIYLIGIPIECTA